MRSCVLKSFPAFLCCWNIDGRKKQLKPSRGREGERGREKGREREGEKTEWPSELGDVDKEREGSDGKR